MHLLSLANDPASQIWQSVYFVELHVCAPTSLLVMEVSNTMAYNTTTAPETYTAFMNIFVLCLDFMFLSYESH